MIKIYRIDFPDGAFYIGQTRQDLRTRLLAHRSNPVNWGVWGRLLRLPTPRISVLSKHFKQERADAAELSQIRKAEKESPRKLLNVNGRDIERNWRKTGKPPLPNGRGAPFSRKRVPKDGYNRKPGFFVCSWCRKRLDSSMFYSDRSRSSGLCSRCKTCSNLKQAAIYAAVKGGGTASEGYQKAKRIVRG
ncbi:MAG: hypothetical protein ISN29_01355 [Gammaproteobacteria bacterium AqS3]|nr:hypothetical protein [Gammaproteobacteria bacterium AqS3]